jgi:peptidoglycan/xylan/chitin deacetylase (PgdA/CDA1 family)
MLKASSNKSLPMLHTADSPGTGQYAQTWRAAAPDRGSPAGRLKGIVRNGALRALAYAARPAAPTYLRCLYCHYVFDDQREQFEEIIVHLKRLGTFVDTATCVDMLKGGRPIDGRYFHLSFDDGFLNNFTNALPILKEQGIPALFFVPSALIGADWQTARDFARSKTIFRGVIEMAAWDDLEKAVAAGYEIGSHTRTHARFSEISANPAALEDEIAGSKAEIQSRLGVDCKYISWPFGTRTDADPASLAAVERAGYDACFGAYRGSIASGVTNRYSIPRHHFEANWPLQHVLYFAQGNQERAP